MCVSGKANMWLGSEDRSEIQNICNDEFKHLTKSQLCRFIRHCFINYESFSYHINLSLNRQQLHFFIIYFSATAQQKHTFLATLFIYYILFIIASPNFLPCSLFWCHVNNGNTIWRLWRQELQRSPCVAGSEKEVEMGFCKPILNVSHLGPFTA